MLNRIILEGRLAADPERKETPNGKVVVRFALPLFNPYQREGESTEWVQCEVWNQPADFIAQYGKKGFLVSVDGRLRNQRYEVNGETKYRTYVAVDRLTLLEPRNRDNAPNKSTSSTQAAPSKPAEKPATPAATDSIDDLFKDFDNLL